MDWKAHALIGAVSASAIAFFLGSHDLFALVAAAAVGALGALVPDLDHQTSKGKQVLDTAVIAAAFLAVYSSGCGAALCIPSVQSMQSTGLAVLAMLGAYFVFFALFKPSHRGITHSLVACFAFGVLAYLIFGLRLGIVGFVGYLSHLVADGEIKIL